MAGPGLIHIDSQGTLDRAVRQLGDAPRGVDRARRRAIAKLLTWVQRQVLRAVSAASGLPQKKFRALARFSAKKSTSETIHIWIGTNPVAAQFLGSVTWNRRMRGARVGKRSFPGSWSWGPGSKTGSAVMERAGGFYAYDSPISGPQETRNREGIREVKVPIDPPVRVSLERLVPDIAARFETLMAQELRYALQVEAAR